MRVAQLPVLSQELQVDEAAAQVLDLPDGAGLVLLRDPPAHVGDIRQEVVAVALGRQDGRDLVLQPLAETVFANDYARPGQRHVLPRPGLALLVAAETLEGNGERPGVPGGPQARVDLVELPLAGERGHGADVSLRQAPEVGAGRQRFFAVRLLGVFGHLIDEYQVEIG